MRFRFAAAILAFLTLTPLTLAAQPGDRSPAIDSALSLKNYCAKVEGPDTPDTIYCLAYIAGAIDAQGVARAVLPSEPCIAEFRAEKIVEVMDVVIAFLRTTPEDALAQIAGATAVWAAVKARWPCPTKP